MLTLKKFYHSNYTKAVALVIPLISIPYVMEATWSDKWSIPVTLMHIWAFSVLLFDELSAIKTTSQNKLRNKRISSNIKPNKFALFFAAALQKPEDREFLIDSIEERFAKDVKRRGLRWAKGMLWRDNLVGFYSAVGVKIIKGAKWAGLGYLIEKIFWK